MNKLLSVTDLAEFLSVHPQTVRNWVKRGMPHFKAPGKGTELKFDKDAVMQWWQKGGESNND